MPAVAKEKKKSSHDDDSPSPEAAEARCLIIKPACQNFHPSCVVSPQFLDQIRVPLQEPGP